MAMQTSPPRSTPPLREPGRSHWDSSKKPTRVRLCWRMTLGRQEGKNVEHPAGAPRRSTRQRATTRVAPTMLRMNRLPRPVYSPLGRESLLNRIRLQSRVRPHRGAHDQGHLDLCLTPIDEQFDSSNKAAVIRGEEHHRFGDFVRIGQPPQRDGDGGHE